MPSEPLTCGFPYEGASLDLFPLWEQVSGLYAQLDDVKSSVALTGPGLLTLV